MNHIKLHRNSQKRFYGLNKIYFITTNTDERFPYFKENLFCELFIENLKTCKAIKNFALYGFVVIPDHVHLLLEPGKNFNISQIMQFLKRHFSRNINFILNEGDRCDEGEICQSRFPKSRFPKNDCDKLAGYHFKWQQSFHDHVIRDEEDFFNHLNYIVLNCVKHKVCYDENEYEWSFLNPKYENLIDDYFA